MLTLLVQVRVFDVWRVRRRWHHSVIWLGVLNLKSAKKDGSGKIAGINVFISNKMRRNMLASFDQVCSEFDCWFFVWLILPFSTSNDASCQRCPSGFYSVVAATACQPCDTLILTYPDQCRDAYVLTPTAFTIVTASYILGLVFTTTTIVLLWMWRADRVMFAASPRILAVMLVGLSLLQTAAYMFGVLQTPRTCAAKYWFLAMGFNLVFGSMFAKVC